MSFEQRTRQSRKAGKVSRVGMSNRAPTYIPLPGPVHSGRGHFLQSPRSAGSGDQTALAAAGRCAPLPFDAGGEGSATALAHCSDPPRSRGGSEGSDLPTGAIDSAPSGCTEAASASPMPATRANAGAMRYRADRRTADR